MAADAGSHQEGSREAPEGRPDTAKDFYVLFRNHTDGFALYELLRKEGHAVRIAPAPHGLVACCGMSLLVSGDQIDAVEEVIEKSDIPIDQTISLPSRIDPGRDRFC